MKKAFLGLVVLSSLVLESATAMNLPESGSNPSPSTVTQICKTPKSDEMKSKIQQNLLKILFFRPDLIGVIKSFLPSKISMKSLPNIYQHWEFQNFLKKSGCEVSASDSSQDQAWWLQTIKQIIAEDNIDLLHEEAEKAESMDAIIEDNFFGSDYTCIPILHYCVMKKAIKCFKFLILSGANPSSMAESVDMIFPLGYKWDCMAVAIASGEWEMMKILEERGIDKLNNPAVWEAAALTHRNNLLKLFISNKDKVQNLGECLQKGMEGAAKGNNLKALKILMSESAKQPNNEIQLNPPLWAASVFDSLEAGKVLIAKGADINASDADDWGGRTSLHFAATFDANAMGKLLISKGADTSVKSIYGRTPLHYAALNNSIKMGELLIAEEADIDAKDDFDWRSLHLAIQNDAVLMLELLISKGADVNAKHEGATPLTLCLDLIELVKNSQPGDPEMPEEVKSRLIATREKIRDILISYGAHK